MGKSGIQHAFRYVFLLTALLVLAACGEVNEPPGDGSTVETVTVTPAEATLIIDGTLQLEAEVGGTGDFSRSVTWSSSDDAVATVSDSGLVTARAVGTARITAASSQTPSVTGASEIVVLAQAAAACTEPDQVIIFGDPQVETAVRALYGAADPEILCGQVQQDITSVPDESGQETMNLLTLSRCEPDADRITSLEGLQHLNRLVRLEASCNGLTDISVLSGMTSLQEVNLDENLVSDLTPLAALTNLEVLGLYANEVEDLTPLAGLTNLQILYLSANRINDLTPLEGLTNLEHLWLMDNCRSEDTECLQDISPLEGHVNLESLVISYNEIGSIAAVASMPDLQFLNASANRIADITPLGGLTQLRTVLLDQNPFGSLAALAGNADFAGGREPYTFQRGEVRLPMGADPYPNLLLGYNCYDPTSAELTGQRDAMVARGVDIEQFDYLQNVNPACTPGSGAAIWRY